MKPLPSLFVSHGSPLHALDPGAAGLAWKAFAAGLPKPEAILIATAHWETGIPMLTGAEQPQTVHDFSGFPDALYGIRYPAPGCPALARRARELLKKQGVCAGVDGTHGLDHGAWTPLLHMYPQADVPVVQLSVQPALGAGHHLALGRMLAPLLGEGVLIIGSGHMTHNLGEAMAALRRGVSHGRPLPYVVEFQHWAGERIRKRETEVLVDYRQRAPHAARAHPSEEHFLPLFIALGAARENYTPHLLYGDIELNSLAMDAWAFL